MNRRKYSEIIIQKGYGIGPFQRLNEIGKGRFGKVYLGIHEETKEYVAIKEIEIEQNKNLDEIHNEINILKILIHPYLCKLHIVIEIENKMYIISEYCSGGEVYKTLYDLEEPFEEKKACKIFTQMLSALEYMHNNFICHRDIKLENMLFDEYGDVKLTDFGLSKSFKNDEYFSTTSGSPMYAPPELMSRKKYKGPPADIWSLGVCLFTMVCGSFPFTGESLEELIHQIKNKDLEIPDSLNISPLFKDLIPKILDKNTKTRLTIEQIKQHPWLHILDFNYLKSPGIILDNDIIPIDFDIIEEITERDKSKIKKLMNDILENKHNYETIIYYLKLDIMKRKNKKTVADIRPISDLFIDYINNKESKLKTYEYDMNIKLEELTSKIFDKFKEENKKIKAKIKEALNIEPANLNPKTKIKPKKKKDIETTNENNKENIINQEDKNNNNSKVPKKKRIKPKNYLAKTYRDLSILFKNVNKAEDNKNNNNKNLDILKEYIGPLLFIHNIIDDIISNVIKSKTKVEEEEKIYDIGIPSTDQELKKEKSEQVKVNKHLNLCIDSIGDFEFPSTSRAIGDGTFSDNINEPKIIKSIQSTKNVRNFKFQTLQKIDKGTKLKCTERNNNNNKTNELILEKNEKKNAKIFAKKNNQIKSIFSRKMQKSNNLDTIEENLNINSIIEEKSGSMVPKKINSSTINSTKSDSFKKREELFTKKIKNINSKNLNFYSKNSKTINTSSRINENDSIKSKGRTILVIRNKKPDKDNETKKLNHSNLSYKHKSIKSTLFGKKNNEIKDEEDIFKKNILKIDKLKSMKNVRNKNTFNTLNKTVIIKDNENTDYEINSKKKESFIKDTIIKEIGLNNMSILNLSKNLTKFSCKMNFVDKKKASFNLKLETNNGKNIISGCFIDGDIKSFENIFNIIKKKLE